MDEKLIRDAQYRKGLSIAFFNATNSAISLVSATLDKKTGASDDQLLIRISQLRDHFIEQHKMYYAEVIANIGKNYNTQNTIESLKEAKDTEQLKWKWLSLSEDERRDGDIIKVKESIKKSYEKI